MTQLITRRDYVSIRYVSCTCCNPPPPNLLTLSPVSSLALLPKSCSVPEIPNFAYLIFAAYFFATGGGYDKLEVYKCSDGVKAPAVTREMVIRFPSCMVSWRHKEFHMVIQMLHLNLLPISTLELSTSTELVTRASEHMRYKTTKSICPS